MTQDEAKAMVQKLGSVSEAARAAGMPRSTFRDMLTGAQKANGSPRKARKAPSARTLEDFRREHDQAWKIRDGLRRLFAGGAYLSDAEFRERVRGNPSRWRAAADMQEFREYRYRVSGELLWASKETIREMRKIRGEAV